MSVIQPGDLIRFNSAAFEPLQVHNGRNISVLPLFQSRGNGLDVPWYMVQSKGEEQIFLFLRAEADEDYCKIWVLNEEKVCYVHLRVPLLEVRSEHMEKVL